MTLPELLERLRAGDQRAVARLISWVEDGDRDQLREAAEALNPAAGRAQVIGLTGSPGVGKSTLAGALVAAYRAQGLTVGVLAVDPSSPFTGGALLGDRVRMQRHALDEGVYIRSMATRGHLGGLAWATPQAVRVLDAAGCDVVLVETVGVGQAEVEVAGLADTTLVALAPGFGDAVQVAKAGILEVADVFVVNKADRDGAEVVARDLRQMLHLGAATPWQVPVLLTVAERGDGVAQLVEAIAAHRAHLASSGELERRRRHRAAREIEEVALASLRTELGELGHGEALDTLAEQVAAGKLGPYSAADQLLAGVRAPAAERGRPAAGLGGGEDLRADDHRGQRLQGHQLEPRPAQSFEHLGRHQLDRRGHHQGRQPGGQLPGPGRVQQRRRPDRVRPHHPRDRGWGPAVAQGPEDPVDQGAVGDGGHRARGGGQALPEPAGGGGHGGLGVGMELAAQRGQGGRGIGAAGRSGQVPDGGHGGLAGQQDGHRLLEPGRVGGHLEQAVDGGGGDLDGAALAVAGGGQDRRGQASGAHRSR